MNFKHPTMRYGLLIGILLTALIAPAWAGDSTTEPITQNRDHRTYDWPTRHKQVIDYVHAHPPSVVWIGDSITHYFGGEPKAPIARAQSVWDKYLTPRHTANLGFGWDRTENVLWRIDHGELDGYSPKLVIVLIGTNNLDFNTADEIAAGITAVVDRIHQHAPAAKVLLLGILPRQHKHKVQPAEVNALIQPLGERDNVTYLDIGPSLELADGKTDPVKFIGDVHPNTAGYAAMCAALEPTLAKLLGEKSIQ